MTEVGKCLCAKEPCAPDQDAHSVSKKINKRMLVPAPTTSVRNKRKTDEGFLDYSDGNGDLCQRRMKRRFLHRRACSCMGLKNSPGHVMALYREWQEIVIRFQGCTRGTDGTR